MIEVAHNRVALVTGGSRGIGRAVVEQLVADGWKVAFTYQSNEEAARSVLKDLGADAGSIWAAQADVRDYARAAAVVSEVEERFGPLHLLVNNAGIKRDLPLHRMEPDDWDAVMQTNLTGVFNYCRNVIYNMIKRTSGSIVNVVSVSGIIGLAGQSNYSASKAGVIGFTKALSKEVARFNIRVNAVAPGFIETEMLEEIPEAVRKRLYSMIPMGSPGLPRQVAQVVGFLAGEGSSYITGQVLPVDGGMV